MAPDARRFWGRRRNGIAALVLGIFGLVALGADLLASELPLRVTLDGQGYWLPALTRPPALRGLTNAALSGLEGTRVSGLVEPPVPFGPQQVDISTAPLARPSAVHWLGTDDVGRDVLARLIHGARASLEVGLLATLLAAALGLLLGAGGGFRGGRADAWIARGMELVQTFPTLFLLLCVMALLPGAGVGVLILVLGLTRWVEAGRLARAEALRLRGLDFVRAARALGSSEARTFAVHVLPAALGPVLVAASLGVGATILLESALSFLGFGVPLPQASWGELLEQARRVPDHWWLAAAPGLAIFAVVSACNALGEGLREVLSARGGDSGRGEP